MPTNAVGTNLKFGYIKETTWAVTPAATPLQLMRATSITPSFSKTYVQSQELTTAREIQDYIPTDQKGGLTFNHELSAGNLDDVLQSVYAADWATNVLKVGTTRHSMSHELQFTDITQFVVPRLHLQQLVRHGQERPDRRRVGRVRLEVPRVGCDVDWVEQHRGPVEHDHGSDREPPVASGRWFGIGRRLSGFLDDAREHTHRVPGDFLGRSVRLADGPVQREGHALGLRRGPDVHRQVRELDRFEHRGHVGRGGVAQLRVPVQQDQILEPPASGPRRESARRRDDGLDGEGRRNEQHEQDHARRVVRPCTSLPGA